MRREPRASRPTASARPRAARRRSALFGILWLNRPSTPFGVLRGRWRSEMADSSYQMLIGGEWTDASDGNTREILSPATGDAIAEVPEGTAADVDRAVAA